MRSRSIRLPIPLLALGIVTLAAAGCETQLMPTPNIYLDGRYALNAPDQDPARRTSEVELLFVTDRQPETDSRGKLRYGWGRSRSVAFGTATLEIGRDVSWETLEANSLRTKRSPSLPVRVRSVRELSRMPDVPPQLVERDGQLVVDPEFEEQVAEAGRVFIEEVRRRTDEAPTNNVSVYVHGFNNTFDYSASILAEFHHFSGRSTVPILYTWPAGSPGLLKGYTHDRDSGQFTIYHFKQFLRALGRVPNVDRVSIIAHSRGTFVVTSALRELMLELRGTGQSPRDTYKIEHVVLASPDLDFEVLTQRLMAEVVDQPVFEHMTIYASSKDKALNLSDWLFGSRVRLGQIRPEDLNEVDRARLAAGDRVDIIDARVDTGFLGHSYYHASPAVSSDILLLLRYGAEAGSPERPLREAIPNYWILDDEDYPYIDER